MSGPTGKLRPKKIFMKQTSLSAALFAWHWQNSPWAKIKI